MEKQKLYRTLAQYSSTVLFLNARVFGSKIVDILSQHEKRVAFMESNHIYNYEIILTYRYVQYLLYHFYTIHCRWEKKSRPLLTGFISIMITFVQKKPLITYNLHLILSFLFLYPNLPQSMSCTFIISLLIL